MPRGRKRKFIERDSRGHAIRISQRTHRAGTQRKKRKISNRSNRSKSNSKPSTPSTPKKSVRKSKRLAEKSKQNAASPTKKRRCISTKTKHKDKKSVDYNAYLFDSTCLYSMLEVFLIGYDLNSCSQNDEEKESIRDDLWEWLWIWEQRASAYYRILITPVFDHNVLEVRVDSIHGIQCGLLSELLLNGLSFEYFYAYSRKQIWGGWKFCHKQRVIQHNIYGNIFDREYQCIWQPPKIWKHIIWFKQLKMELMYKKYGAHNMNHRHLNHYRYGHQQFKQIDGSHQNPKTRKKSKGNVQSNKEIDFESYHMAQIFDTSWCKMHEINEHSIRLNVDDLSMILGTKQKMRCAQCHQTYHLCRAVKLCDSFKGCFVVRDLYQRHQSMVEEWK